jgi:Domain of Unknown Function (DUF1080)
MKLTNTIMIIACLGTIGLFTKLIQAQPSQAAPAGATGNGRGAGFGRGGQPFDFADNEGWISLFNGQSLNGWDGDPRFWSVKDDSIYVEPSCEHPTGTIYLVWQGGDVADFMLKFEAKGTLQVNGGVQFRSYLTSDSNVGLKYPPRGGGRAGGPGNGGGRGAPVAGGQAGPPAGGAPVAGRGAGGGGGRGPQCANPGTPPTAAEKAKWDMAGPQFDFDANNRYPGQYYEQSSTRGIAAAPGTVVLAERGQRRVLATLADQATRDSWFKKDDYNQFLLIAKGNTSTMYMNGHLMSVFIDNDPDYFRPSGKIGIEVEATGAYFTKNIWLKRM